MDSSNKNPYDTCKKSRCRVVRFTNPPVSRSLVWEKGRGCERKSIFLFLMERQEKGSILMAGYESVLVSHMEHPLGSVCQESEEGKSLLSGERAKSLASGTRHICTGWCSQQRDSTEVSNYCFQSWQTKIIDLTEC